MFKAKSARIVAGYLFFVVCVFDPLSRTVKEPLKLRVALCIDFSVIIYLV